MNANIKKAISYLKDANGTMKNQWDASDFWQDNRDDVVKALNELEQITD